jgi:hypothetical protein
MFEEQRPDKAAAEPNRRREQVLKAVAWGGAATVVAVVAAALTRAATHQTAVRENCFAYVNGLNDGYGLAIERLSELLGD